MPLADRLTYEIDADDNTARATESAERNFRELARTAEREFDDIGDAADRAERDIDDMGGGGEAALGKLAGAFALVGGAGAIGGFLQGVIETGVELDNLSEATGLTVEELSTLRNTAERNGVEFDALISSFRTMQDRMVDVTRGGTDSIEMFQLLGLNVDAVLKLEPAEQFATIADAIFRIEDPTQRAGLASQALGDDYLALFSVMAETEGGMSSLIDRAEELATITTEDAEAAVAFNQAWADAKATLEGLATVTLPAVGRAMEAITLLIQGEFGQLFDIGLSNLLEGSLPARIARGFLTSGSGGEPGRPPAGGGRPGSPVVVEVDGREVARATDDADFRASRPRSRRPR